MKKLFLLLLFFGFCGSAQAADIYFAQAAAGGNTGANCANAKVFPPLIGDQVAGNILHICGTITGTSGAVGFTALASGGVGNPITIKFETGAKMSAPYWSAAIDLNGKSNWVVDGGTVCGYVNQIDAACNGIIENTASGSGLANPNPSCPAHSGNNCTLIYVNGGDHIEIKNLALNNTYVKLASNTSTDGGSNKAVYFDSATQTDLHVHNNWAHDANSTVFVSYGTGVTNVEVDHNVLQNTVAGVGVLDANRASSISGVKVHDNDISGFQNWQGPNGGDNFFHQDGVFFSSFNGSASFTASSIYNNYIHGPMTNPSTGDVYLSGNSGNMSGIDIINNIMVMPANTLGHTADDAEGLIVIGFKAHAGIIANNTGIATHTPCIDIRETGSNVAAFKNNLCMGTDSTNVMYEWVNNKITANISGGIWDNNAYFNGNNLHLFSSADGANNYTSIAAWRTACGCDLASTVGNPNLSATFVPQTPSVAINAGTNLTSLGITALNSDAAGNARPGSGAWTAGALNASGGTAQAVLTPSSNNYGNVVQHVTSAPVTFTLTNPSGTANLVLSTPCCSTSGTNGPDFVISAKTCTDGQVLRPALDSCTISVTFTPNIVGAESGVLHTGGNASGNANLSGTGTAPATAAVNITPNPVPFPNQNVGSTSSPATVTTVTNTGLANLVLNNPTYFTISPSGEFVVTGGTCGPGSTVAPNTQCTILATFTPSAAGARQATLTVNGNASGSTTLNGTGVAVGAPSITVTPASFNFGNQLKGTTSSLFNFTIKNVGTAAATMGSPFFSFTGGSNPTDFARVSPGGSDCVNGQSLAINATCLISVAFTPTTAALETGGLNIFSDAATVISSLSGTGTFPVITITPSPIPFGSTNQGTSVSKVVTIKNTGTAPLTFANPPITFTGPTAPYFTVSSTTCNPNLTLAINGTCTVTVAFLPGSAGNFTDTFVVNAISGQVNKLYTLVGTISASTITYSMTSSNPAGTTASWSMPVHPVPAESAVAAGAFTLGFAFQFPTPTSFLFNGSPVSPLTLIFYSTSGGGGVSAFSSGSSFYFSTDFAPQIYSGPENAPTMLAGTFVLPDTANTLGTPFTASAIMTGTGILVAPVITLTPRPVVFPSQITGVTSPSVPVTVTNSGNAIETFSTTTITTGDSGDFMKVAGGTCGATLAAGGSCTLLFTFTPSGAPRLEQTMLTVNGTALATVTLQGLGISPGGGGGAPVPIVIATQIDLFPAPRVSVVGKNFLAGKTQITIDGVPQVPACDTTTHCGVTLPASAVLLPRLWNYRTRHWDQVMGTVNTNKSGTTRGPQWRHHLSV